MFFCLLFMVYCLFVVYCLLFRVFCLVLFIVYGIAHNVLEKLLNQNLEEYFKPGWNHK